MKRSFAYKYVEDYWFIIEDFHCVVDAGSYEDEISRSELYPACADVLGAVPGIHVSYLEEHVPVRERRSISVVRADEDVA